MSLAQGNNAPTRPRIEPGSPDPESNALTTRPVRSRGFVLSVYRKQRHCLAAQLIFGFILVYVKNRFSRDTAYSLGAIYKSIMGFVC